MTPYEKRQGFSWFIKYDQCPGISVYVQGNGNFPLKATEHIHKNYKEHLEMMCIGINERPINMEFK